MRALADRLGILPEFVDLTGRQRRTSDGTRVALLSALGFDASTDAAARQSLVRFDARESAALLAPVRVVVGSQSDLPLRVRVPEGVGDVPSWHL